MREQLVQEETERLRRLNLDPEMTRNSASAQIKALSMIIAIEGLIPDRRAGSSEKKSASQVAVPQIDAAACLRKQQGKPPAPSPALTLSETKMGLAFPFLRPPRRLSAPRKRPRRRLMPPCPLLFQTTRPLPL